MNVDQINNEQQPQQQQDEIAPKYPTQHEVKEELSINELRAEVKAEGGDEVDEVDEVDELLLSESQTAPITMVELASLEQDMILSGGGVAASNIQDLPYSQASEVEELETQDLSVADKDVADEVSTTSTQAKDKEKRPRKKRQRKPIPWVKILTFEHLQKKFKVSVDAFNYAPDETINHYFLSHFHSDHYYGITKSWNNGIIYCSEVTANLLVLKYKIDVNILVPLKMNVTYELVENLFITLIDANHCPGAAIILFEHVLVNEEVKSESEMVKQEIEDIALERLMNIHYINEDSVKNRRYIRAKENNGVKIYRVLHTGDFRVSKRMVMHPLLSSHKIDKLYLDTTYMNPMYSFPEQDLVVKECGKFGFDLLTGAFYEKLTAQNSDQSLLFFQKRITDFFSAIAKPVVANKRKKRKTTTTTIKAEEPTIIDLEEEARVCGFKHNYLICIGTYLIGKEKLAIELARKLNLKIFANFGKRDILKTFDQEFLPYEELITTDPYSTNIHLIPMRSLHSVDTLEKYYLPLKLTFKNVIGIRPTGWSLRGKPSFSAAELRTLTKEEVLVRSIENKMFFSADHFATQFNSNKAVQVYEIPYSEHSSFRELCLFIILMNVDKIIPTVNLHHPEVIRQMEEWFAECKQLKERRSYTADDF